MPFLTPKKYRKPPASTIFAPLLKLFKTMHQSKPRKLAPEIQHLIRTDESPILLSGPKSRYGLRIGLHFLTIPDPSLINVKHVWKCARQDVFNALITGGLPENEADMFTYRLIDLLDPPAEIMVEIADEDVQVLQDFRLLITYQLLQGQSFDGTNQSLEHIYHNLAETFELIQENQYPPEPEAQKMLTDLDLRNIAVIVRQEDIEKNAILDIEGKLKEITEYFKFIIKPKYLRQAVPQDVEIIQHLYS